jgi:hypothetical protein
MLAVAKHQLQARFHNVMMASDISDRNRPDGHLIDRLSRKTCLFAITHLVDILRREENDREAIETRLNDTRPKPSE